ncbi:MAG: hypothetical protein WCJ84_04260 [Candidatus Peregrinibacteria bacterium]
MTSKEINDWLRASMLRADRIDAEIAELRASQNQTDEQMKRTDEQMKRTDEQLAKTDAKLDKLAKLYGNSENNKGREVEEFFYRYFEKEKSVGKVHFDEVERNLVSSHGEDSEHDIVLMNGNSSAVISVKHTLKKADIDHLVTEEVPRFQRLFLRYVPRSYTLYSGIASFVVDKEIEKYATEKGVLVFTRAGKDVQLKNAELV